MAIADMLPTMDDASLASLRANASRLETDGDGARQKQASALLPLIDAELAERAARKPPKVTKAKAVKATKTAAPRKKAKAKADEDAEMDSEAE